MKPITTWVLIADGAQARVLSNDGPGRGLKRVAGLTFEGDRRRTSEMVSDQRGRSFDSVGEGRHGMEPPTDPQRDAKASFAGELADMLDAKLAALAYDRLIVIAAPATLGDLRQAMSDHVAKTLHAELDKDLTNTPDPDIAKHLEDVLAV